MSLGDVAPGDTGQRMPNNSRKRRWLRSLTTRRRYWAQYAARSGSANRGRIHEDDYAAVCHCAIASLADFFRRTLSSIVATQSEWNDMVLTAGLGVTFGKDVFQEADPRG